MSRPSVMINFSPEADGQTLAECLERLLTNLNFEAQEKNAL